MNQRFSRLKFLSLVFLIAGIVIMMNPQTLLAHRPHDDIYQVKISPQYNQDQTLFIIVRGNLFKSTDGGSSWQRLTKGLDNRAKLLDFTVSPTDKNSLFLLSARDGIYKSENGGDSWFQINKGLENLKIDLPFLSTKSSDFVLEALSADLVFVTGSDPGLYITQNGGESWSSIPEIQTKVTSIASSENQQQILVGDSQGNLYSSTDNGQSWKKIFTQENSDAITTISLSSNFSSDLTYFLGTQQNGVLKTVDNGKSFTVINQDLSDLRIQDIVISPGYQENKTLFVSTWDNGFFYSDNGGETWIESSSGLIKDKQADEERFQTPHFKDLEISPAFQEDKTLFLGGFTDLFKSTDRGESWQALDTLSPDTIVALDISPNYENDGTLAIVDYVGKPYITQDKGQTWAAIDKGLETPRFTNNFEPPYQEPQRFFDIAFSPNYSSDQTLFASLLWTNIIKSTDGGASWKIITLPKVPKSPVRGMTIAISPTFASDSTIYVGTQKGVIYQSTNGGNDFSVIGRVGNKGTNIPLSLVISPDFFSDKTLYASATEGIYKTTDGGKTWQGITEGKMLQERANIRLAISPNYTNDQTLIAGTEQGLFLSQDAGETWNGVSNLDEENDVYIEGIDISPDYENDKTFVVSVRGKGVFKTTNGGQTLTPIGNSALALSRISEVPSAGRPIQFSPAYSTDQTLYGFGSAEAQIFQSINSGQTWQVLDVPHVHNQGYDNLTQMSLVFHVYRGQFFKAMIAVLLAISSYLILGYLHLESKLPLSQWQIKIGGAFIILIIAFIILVL